jgi:hypothetical protein
MSTPRSQRNKSGQKRRKRSYRKPSAWQKSEVWRQIGSEAIRAFNARRHLLPKCGAHAKSTGEPCRNLALANGRCRVHGGRTPAGEQYGVRQFTPKRHSRQAKSDWPKVQAKLDKLAKLDKGRRVRLALMTSDEFTAYFRRTHARHSPEFRKIVDTEVRRRGLSRADLMPTAASGFDAARPAAVNPEVARLGEEIARLRALQAEIEAAKEGGDDVAAGELEDALTLAMFGGDPPQPSESAPGLPARNGDAPGADDNPALSRGVFD